MNWSNEKLKSDNNVVLERNVLDSESFPHIEYNYYNKLPDTGSNGEIAIVPNRHGVFDQYVYFDDWTEIGDVEKDDVNKKHISYTNCPNCGAVVNKNLDACPYCDTPYVKTYS